MGCNAPAFCCQSMHWGPQGRGGEGVGVINKLSCKIELLTFKYYTGAHRMAGGWGGGGQVHGSMGRDWRGAHKEVWDADSNMLAQNSNMIQARTSASSSLHYLVGG